MSAVRLSEGLAAAYAFLVVAGDLLAWEPVATTKVVALALVAASAFRWATEPSARPPFPTAGLSWVGVALLVGLSLLWTADSDATRRVLRHLAQEGVVGAALALAPGRKRLLGAVATGAALGAVALALGLCLAFVGGDPRGGRLALGEGDANLQARSVAIGALLLFGGRRDPRLVGLGAALCGVGLGLTGSRGAALAFVVAVPVLRRRAAWIGLVGLALGSVLLLSRPDVRPPVPVDDREALTSGRDAIWANTFEIIADHPVLGVGAGAVPSVYDTYRDARMARGGLHSKRGRDPHSHYLQLLAELGPVGFLLFVVGFVGIGRRVVRTDAVASSLLLFVAVAAATSESLEQKVFWLGLVYVTLAAYAVNGVRDGPATRPAPGGPA